MTSRETPGTCGYVVLCLSVLALLSAGVGNMLLAVTESVLWPLILGMNWVIVAAAVVAAAKTVTPSRSRTHRVAAPQAVAVAPVRLR